MSDVKHLVSKNVSVQSCASDITSQLNDIDQIYIVYRKKDGDYCTSQCGDRCGLSFAIMLLQKELFDNLNG